MMRLAHCFKIKGASHPCSTNFSITNGSKSGLCLIKSFVLSRTSCDTLKVVFENYPAYKHFVDHNLVII